MRRLNSQKQGQLAPVGLLTSIRLPTSGMKLLLLGVYTGWMGFSALAQSTGANPAVGTRVISRAPLEKAGSVFSISFSIGNAGPAAPITGTSEADRMGFIVNLQGCRLNGSPGKALSGTLLSLFDVCYDEHLNRIEGQQKANVGINPISFSRLIIEAVVTKASNSTADNTIGAACTVLPNASAQPVQSIKDDYGFVYTHTQETVLSDLPVAFVAQSQPDNTVLLSWSFSPKQADRSFVIERSTDKKSFERVTRLNEGKMGDDKLNHFQFADTKPYRGTSYYRLGLVDGAGHGSAYQTKLVMTGSGYGVATELASGRPFTLKLDEPETAILHLYTDTGKELNVSRAKVDESTLRLNPTDKLEQGVYILMVQERAITRQHRLIIR